MENISVTAIGASGSGKTCFLLAMYYEMSAGVNGYTLTAVEEDHAIELRKAWERLNETQGPSRFPMGTDETTDYKFNLEYAYQQIRSFNWIDYRGGILDTVNKEGQEEETEYKEFVDRIKKSECLCIFIDGDTLCETEEGRMKDNIRKRCTSKVNGFLSKYKDGKEEEKKDLPPVAIVVTKYDRCKKYVQKDQLIKVIKEAIPSLFVADGNIDTVTIIPVSAGNNFDNEEIRGTLQPINIYKPLFFGIYYPLRREKDAHCKKRDEVRNQLAVLRAEYSKIEKKIFHKRKKQREREKLEKTKKELAELNEIVNKYEKYVEKVNSELKGLYVFEKGSQKIWE